MATTGQTATPSSSFFWTGANTENQVCWVTSMPENGLLSEQYCYFAGKDGSITAQLVLWDGQGNILAQSGNFSVAPGSLSPGGQAWHGRSMPAVALSDGQTLLIGWWRAPSQAHIWSVTGSGSHRVKTSTSGSPDDMVGNSTESGNLGAYIVYWPSVARVKQTDGSWAVRNIYVKQANGSWAIRQAYIRQSNNSWRIAS